MAQQPTHGDFGVGKAPAPNPGSAAGGRIRSGRLVPAVRASDGGGRGSPGRLSGTATALGLTEGGGTKVDSTEDGIPGPVTRANRRPMPLRGVLVFVVVAALAITAWSVTRQGVDNQSKALLQNSVGQINLLLQNALTSLQTQFRTAAYFTTTSGDSPTVFAQQAGPLRQTPTVSVALVDTSGPTARVVLALGPDLSTGTTLPAALVATARQGSTALTSSIERLGGRTLLALAAAPSTTPTRVLLETSRIDQSKATPNTSGPYSHVYVDVFAGTKPRPQDLILSTYGPKPLPAPTASAPLKVGSLEWLTQASPRGSLVGGSADAAPWIILGIGLAVALLLGLFIEVISRRQRYAQDLVDERTAELISAQKSLLLRERLAAVGEMATVVSHELRNPLSAVINDLYLLRRSVEGGLNERGERHLANAEQEVYRAARLSEDLLSYTRERSPHTVDVDFASLADEVLQATPPPEGVDVAVESSVLFPADPSLMNQVLVNLVTNAYQAMPGGGSLRLAARQEDGATVISVQDTGSGFDDAVLDRVFDPFFTTKEGGTGLGLAIVQRLVQAHQGHVTVENVPSGGAMVSVRLGVDGS